MTQRLAEPERGVQVAAETVPRVEAAKELLRLERRIARSERALTILRVHREALLTLIGGGGA